MNKILDPRDLVFYVADEQILMPAEDQWDDTWMASHVFALSPLVLTRQRQGSLGDPDPAQASFTLVVPHNAASTVPVPVTAPTVTAGSTVTRGVAWDGDVWDDMRSGSTNAPPNGTGRARYYVALADLVGGAAYRVSAEIGNRGSSPVRVGIDWCDRPAARPWVTVPPGARTVITTTQGGTYSSTYRFVDITTDTASVDVLIRDVQVVPASGVAPFGDGVPSLHSAVEIAVAGSRLFFGTVESMVLQDPAPVRLPSGTVVDAVRIEVGAVGVLRILARTRIGYTPDDLPDATGNTVGFRLGQITAAVKEVSGLDILWDRLAPELPTSWVADRDVDSQPALDVIRDTVTLADRVVIERGPDYSIVRRDAITQAPYDYYTIPPYVRDSPNAVVVPAAAVPTPAWALDAEGLATQFAFGYVDETQIPGSLTPVDTNQAVGDPVAIFDSDGILVGWQRPEWLERTERTTRVDHLQAEQDYGVSTWAVRGDGMRTIRQFGAATPAGGPGNAELRGVLVARFGTPQWRPDGGISLLLGELEPGDLDPVLYGYEPPFGFPLLTITDAPPGREHWRVVGSTLAIGHADDEAVSLTLEHPSLGLPTGVRSDELDPLVTIASTRAPGWTWLDCIDARTIQSGTVLQPPGTPTNLRTSRISDTATSLTWTSSGGPATSAVVEEQVNGSPVWTRSAIITVRAGAAEVATAADRSTRYRVTLANPAGTSGTSAPSPTIRTRPNLLPGPGWVWSGRDIVGSWLLDTAIPPDQYTIQIYRGIVSLGGSYTWDAGPTLPDGQQFASLPGGTTSYTYANAPRPPTGAYCWAALARVTTVDGSSGYLRSSYKAIGTADEY